jgi:hypothetical protein
LYFNIILTAIKASSYSLDSAPLTLFPTFVLVLTSFCLLIVGVEDYRCTLSHSVTHTQTHFDRTLLDEGPSRRRKGLSAF